MAMSRPRDPGTRPPASVVGRKKADGDKARNKAALPTRHAHGPSSSHTGLDPGHDPADG